MQVFGSGCASSWSLLFSTFHSFKGRILVLLVPVPDLCVSSTFNNSINNT